MSTFCKSCGIHSAVRDDGGFLCCSRCGKVFRFDNFSTEATFVKNSSGQSQLDGRIVKSIGSENFSRQRLFDKAYDDLTTMKLALGMGENIAIVNQALVFYRIAVERNFTKGRRTEQVQAASLYIACRENRRPYLLIDFSNYLRINVFVLGAVFLQLCKVLNLTEHPICQKLLDPSIFIHRYTVSLAGGKNKEISDSALSIIASMNRDWIQTGRRPSGLWGAALYIAAVSHGIRCSKSDILRLVHVCEATLSKRLVEFEDTDSASLTIEELNAKAEELKECNTTHSFSMGSKSELLCKHKGSYTEPFAFGLCKDCYAYFIGFEGGSDPPAFKHSKEGTEQEDATHQVNQDANNLDDTNSRRQEFSKPVDIDQGGGNGEFCTSPEMDKVQSEPEDFDNFSDIDDSEVDGYLHSEEEARFKKIIWEEMNREYLEEQAAKEAAAAALRASMEASFRDCPEGLQSAKDLDATIAAAMAKSKKEKKQKRDAEAKNETPAQSASEAAARMLTKKRLASKINFDALDKLFNEPASDDAKKQRVESPSAVPDVAENTDESKGSGDLEPHFEDELYSTEATYADELYTGNFDQEYDGEYAYDGF